VPLVRYQYPGGEWKTDEAIEIAEATQTKRSANPKQRRIRASCFSEGTFQEKASPCEPFSNESLKLPSASTAISFPKSGQDCSSC
jgi:hypothetical protein